MSAATLRSWNAARAHLRDVLLLEEAEKTVRALPSDRRAAAARLHRAAMNHAQAASDLGEESSEASALVLYREATRLLIPAVLLAREPEAKVKLEDFPPPSVALPALQALASAGHIPPLPAEVEAHCRRLEDSAPVGLDTANPEELSAQRATAAQAVQWLADRLELRTVAQVRLARFARLALAAGVAIAVLVYAVARLLEPRNLALHRPVRISGMHANAVCPPDGSGLTNGDIESNYGVHTASGSPASPAWVLVDLQRSSKIGKIQLFNRVDGWTDDGLPMTVELSDDAISFTPVGVCAASFTSTSPCIVDGGGRRGRYVRVRSNNYVALTELKVFSARGK